MIFSLLKCFDHWAVCFDVSFIVSERVDNQFEKGKKLLKFSSNFFSPYRNVSFSYRNGSRMWNTKFETMSFLSFWQLVCGVKLCYKTTFGLEACQANSSCRSKLVNCSGCDRTSHVFDDFVHFQHLTCFLHLVLVFCVCLMYLISVQTLISKLKKLLKVKIFL